MIHKNINIVLAGLFVAISLFSCVAPIDIDTRNSEPVIVIYGQITDEHKSQYIRITSSSPYFDEKTNTTVPDAIVSVTSSNGDEYSFINEKEGYYVSEKFFAAIPGVTYNLTVEVDFNKDGVMETYEAETTIPSLVLVDSVDVKLISIMGYRHYTLNIYMPDPPEEENYYLCRFLINDSISNSKISEYIATDDRMFNGQYVSGATVTYFEDSTDEKNVAAQNSRGEGGYMAAPGDEISLQVINIEKGYFNFINECISEKYGENPFFGGPPSNITTNLSNGAVGYFTGFCVRENKTTVP